MSFKELADWQAKFILVPQAQFIADHEKKLGKAGQPYRRQSRLDELPSLPPFCHWSLYS
jgi:hypothetical protein